MSGEFENLVWITGATSGIGEQLARTCPWENTKVISVSRRDHPDHETVRFDLTDPESWDRVGEDVKERLATFTGQRALFIHNALYYWESRAFAGEGPIEPQRKEITANVVAPLVLGDLFLRYCGPAVDAGVDVGLIQISSASARIAYPGLANYGAGKAAMEQWVRAVRKERKHREKGPWVCAIRPGFVDTPAPHRDAAMPPDTYPAQAGVVEALATGKFLTVEESAANIWNAIPEQCKEHAVLLFGEPVGVTH